MLPSAPFAVKSIVDNRQSEAMIGHPAWAETALATARRGGPISKGSAPTLRGLPARDCLVVAIATPITTSFRPDADLLVDRCRGLMEDGCDGIALFGTT